MLTKADIHQLQQYFGQSAGANGWTEFPNDPCYGLCAGRKMFMVQDEYMNERLSQQFGLVTGDNEHELQGYVFWFNWAVQKWMVGT